MSGKELMKIDRSSPSGMYLILDQLGWPVEGDSGEKILVVLAAGEAHDMGRWDYKCFFIVRNRIFLETDTVRRIIGLPGYLRAEIHQNGEDGRETLSHYRYGCCHQDLTMYRSTMDYLMKGGRMMPVEKGSGLWRRLVKEGVVEDEP